MKKEFIWAGVSGLLFFIIGITISNVYGQRKKPQRQPVKRSIYSISTPVNDAHNLSVNHRVVSGYCPATVLNNREGYLDFSYDNAADLLSTMYIIRRQLPVNQRPSKFRLIYGKPDQIVDNRNSVMMVVGLRNTDQSEILDDGNPNPNPLIYKLDDILDCPVRCNIRNSTIIYGNTPDTDNSCNLN